MAKSLPAAQKLLGRDGATVFDAREDRLWIQRSKCAKNGRHPLAAHCAEDQGEVAHAKLPEAGGQGIRPRGVVRSVEEDRADVRLPE